MLGKIVLALKVVFMLVSISSCGPLSHMKHIALHVQSEVLEGHKIVITLQPHSNTNGDAWKSGKTFVPHIELTKDNSTINATPANDESVSSTEEGSEVLWVLDESTSTSGGPTDATAPSLASETNRTTTNATTATTPSTSTKVGVVVIPGSSDPEDHDVSHFLVTVPGLSCPHGYRPDPSGKCREVYSSLRGTGKSMISSNYLSGNVKKYYEKDFRKKFRG